MFKNKQKWTILAVMVTLSLFLLSGNILAQTVLEAWHVGTTETEKKVINQAVDRFNESHPDYKIKPIAMNDDAYKTKLKVAASGGKMPDLFITWGGGPLKEYVDSDVVYNMHQDLEESGILDKLPDASRNLVEIDGKVWGVPVYGVSGVFIWYNKDIFNKYDISVPETWEELEQAVKTLKENGVIPIALANATKWPGTEWYEYLVYRMGGVEPYEKAKKNSEEVSFKDDIFIEAAEKLQEFVEMGAFVDGFNALSYGKGESRALIYTEKAAMELMGNWWYTASLSEAPDFVKEKIGFFTFPEIKGGEGDPSTLIGSAGGGNCWSIAKSCQHKDVAFDFIEILADEETSKMAIETGELPTIKGRRDYIDNAILQKQYDVYNQAAHVQNYWDQDLPPQVGEVYKTASQELLGLSITPQEFVNRVEKAVERYYSE